MQKSTDKRLERRRKVFMQASVCAMDGTQIVECSIQDTSRLGCKIISDELELIPDELVLSIHGLGETFVGRVVWRDGGIAGIEFIQNQAQ